MFPDWANPDTFCFYSCLHRYEQNLRKFHIRFTKKLKVKISPQEMKMQFTFPIYSVIYFPGLFSFQPARTPNQCFFYHPSAHLYITNTDPNSQTRLWKLKTLLSWLTILTDEQNFLTSGQVALDSKSFHSFIYFHLPTMDGCFEVVTVYAVMKTSFTILGCSIPVVWGPVVSQCIISFNLHLRVQSLSALDAYVYSLVYTIIYYIIIL